MRTKIRYILIVVVAFAGGMMTYSQLDAKLTAELPRTPERIRKQGRASWYSQRSPGINRHTANNEIFKDTDLTCAMWGVPFNQRIKVTNLANGKSITVRVNDRGPHRRFVRKGRIVDLTQAAFSQIASLKTGLIDVELEFLDNPR